MPKGLVRKPSIHTIDFIFGFVTEMQKIWDEIRSVYNFINGALDSVMMAVVEADRLQRHFDRLKTLNKDLQELIRRRDRYQNN